MGTHKPGCEVYRGFDCDCGTDAVTEAEINALRAVNAQLVEALRELVEWVDRNEFDNYGFLVNSRAALAAAGGEQEEQK